MNERQRTWIAAGVPVVLGALLGCTRLGSLDLPLMLENGRVILESGEIPRTNVFSWVNQDHAYLNDKWGFMVLVAAVARTGGEMGLAVLKMALGALMGALLYALSRRTLPLRAAAVTACIALTMLSYRLQLRAEWISYLGVAATLLLLPRIDEGSRRAPLVQVALMPLWAACHGYWVLGPIVVLAWGVGARSRRVLTTGVACIAAAAISPYGVENVLHPVHVLGQIGGPLAAAVTEMRTPFSGEAPVTFFHGLAIALTLVAVGALFVAARARRLAEALVIAALLAVSWRLDRNLGMLGLTLPVAAGVLPRFARYAVWGDIVWLVGATGLVGGVDAIAMRRLPGPGFHPTRYPQALVESLHENPEWDEERYINDFSIGSYLVFARGQAFIDGNAEGYTPKFLAHYRSILEGDIGVREVEELYAPDGWLLRTSSAPTRVLVLALFIDGAYAPARWDGVATLFRDDLDPEEATRRWQRWLLDVYLPVARDWFPAPEEALRRAREALPPEHAQDEFSALRAAIQLQPWDEGLYRDLARGYSARGEHRQAALCRRWSYLLTPPSE